MDEPKDKPNAPEMETPEPGKSQLCTCVKDQFADLPPDLRPRGKNSMGDLRKVTCPSCGLIYWTNRKIDLCMRCEKKGMRLPGG
jgi:hypothetical protein